MPSRGPASARRHTAPGHGAAVVLVAALAACASTAEDTADWTPREDAADRPDATDSGCPPGLTPCGPICADLTTDPGHCGSCDRTCGPAEVCNEGACATACGGGMIACAGACVDPATDEANCGGCGHVCPDALHADALCELSTCILVCQPGWQDRDGAPGCETACSGSGTSESCNGIDDDCDGATDEDFPCSAGRATDCVTTCGTTGAGVCTPACTPPGPEACVPPVESCNGRDDDCDTLADDGFACVPGASGSCATPCGSAGTRSCNAACTWDACVAPAETCNGFDDDCDTTADDGFACAAGSVGSCATTCGSTGVRTCSAACTWSACEPPAETCNGRDDDCDTLADNGFFCVAGTSEACTTGCGSSGTRVCSAGCAWGPCTAGSETCNGRDDDCDTAIDNGFVCAQGSTGACGTPCGSVGSRLCSPACEWGPCNPPPETCNGADDDCDGTTDDGFRTVVDRTTYGTLGTFHWPCDGSTQIIGPDCNAAIHRYCGSPARGCATSGFGPVGYWWSTVDVTCVIAPPAINAGFPALAAQHAGCDGWTQRAGAACNAAINRYCQSLGYVSGFGPVENSYPDAWIVCVPATTAVGLGTSYSTLSAFNGTCDGYSERWGVNCNAAIHDYCRSLGYVSGFGPTENSGDYASIVCLSS